MRLDRAEREFFRKRLENFFVKNTIIKQCEVVGHFVKEGIAWQTVHNAFNRQKNGQAILEENRPVRPSSWTSPMKVKLKRLVKTWKGVSPRRLGGKFDKHQTIRQIKKLGISNYACKNTPIYNEKTALKAKKKSYHMTNLLYKLITSRVSTSRDCRSEEVV